MSRSITLVKIASFTKSTWTFSCKWIEYIIEVPFGRAVDFWQKLRPWFHPLDAPRGNRKGPLGTHEPKWPWLAKIQAQSEAWTSFSFQSMNNTKHLSFNKDHHNSNLRPKLIDIYLYKSTTNKVVCSLLGWIKIGRLLPISIPACMVVPMGTQSTHTKFGAPRPHQFFGAGPQSFTT